MATDQRAGWYCIGCGWSGAREDATQVVHSLTCPECGTAVTPNDEPLTDCEDICMEQCQGPCGVFS